MIILRDPILSRARTFNQLQILDFLSRLDAYYERKLIDLANNRFDSVGLSRFLLIDLPREAYTITQYSEIEYEVHNDSKDTTYQVDVSLGICECRTGKTGAPCKHQLLVFRNFTVPIYDCTPPNTSAEKNIIFLVATGHSMATEATENVPKAVTTTMPEANQKSLYMTSHTSDIIMHDLDPCHESAFFLDDTGACDSITSSSILNQPVQLPSAALVQSGSVLEQHSAQDSILSSQNLLSQLDPSSPTPIPLSSDLSLPLDQPLPTDPPVESSEHTEIENVTEIIDHICKELKEKTSKSPSTFKPALHTFLKNLKNVASDSSLEYSLYSFGKFSKTATPLFKRKIADNKLIGLQSTGELKKRKAAVKMLKSPQKDI